MRDITQDHANYQRIAQVIEYLAENKRSQPQLKELSAYVGLSSSHLQRVFSEWAGVSPKQFLQYLTKENAKSLLRNNSVLDSALLSGLSGSGRLHDLMVTYESVTPGEYRSSGVGLDIVHGTHSSPFGSCFIALTPRGICKLAFVDSENERLAVLKELESEWSHAFIEEDVQSTAVVCNRIFHNETNDDSDLKLILKGSPFQIEVWQALLKIPSGELASYQQVAESIGRPTSVRAVASAVARNKVAYLIPCHRVIRSTGVLNNYRWGGARKAAMVGREGCSELT